MDTTNKPDSYDPDWCGKCQEPRPCSGCTIAMNEIRNPVVRTADGHYAMRVDDATPALSPWDSAGVDNRLGTGAAAKLLGTSTFDLPVGDDPELVKPHHVLRIKARVGKRVLFDGRVQDGAGPMLAKLQEHGRRLHVTLWMVDGSKRVYRGNGERIR